MIGLVGSSELKANINPTLLYTPHLMSHKIPARVYNTQDNVVIFISNSPFTPDINMWTSGQLICLFPALDK